MAQLSPPNCRWRPGLRAAGQESGSPKLARAFYWLADQLDRGRPLEEVLDSSAGFLPVHVGNLVRAGAGDRPTRPGPDRTGRAVPRCRIAPPEHSRRVGLPAPDPGHGNRDSRPRGRLRRRRLRRNLRRVRGQPRRSPSYSSAFATQQPWLLPVVARLRHDPRSAAALGLGRPVGTACSARGRARPDVAWLGLLEWMGLLQVLVRNGMTLFDALRLRPAGPRMPASAGLPSRPRGWPGKKPLAGNCCAAAVARLAGSAGPLGRAGRQARRVARHGLRDFRGPRPHAVLVAARRCRRCCFCRSAAWCYSWSGRCFPLISLVSSLS